MTTPHMYCTWDHALLVERIRDLNDGKFKAFTDESGMFYGSPRSVRALIGAAIEAFESDDLSRAERCCDIAERKMLIAARRFRLKSHAEKLAYARAEQVAA